MNDLDPGIVAEVRAAYESEGRAYAGAVLRRHYPVLTEAATRAVVERVLSLPGEPWDAAEHHPWMLRADREGVDSPRSVNPL